MEQKNYKGFLYLLPAFLFLGFFLIYPLIDVFVYSFQENYNFASQTYTGVGLYNYQYVLRDPYFLQALKNTFLLVVITVHRTGSADFPVPQLHPKAPGSVSDCFLPALCNKYLGGGPGFHDPIQKDRLF